VIVENIMKSPVKTIDKDQGVTVALDIMEKLGISAIPVTQDNKLIGLITEVDIVDRLGSARVGKLTPASIHVSSVMEYNPTTIQPSMGIFEAAKLLLKRKERALPVMKDEEIVGIITNTHFVKQCQDITDIRVEDLKLEKPISVSPSDRVVHARQLILSEGLPGRRKRWRGGAIAPPRASASTSRHEEREHGKDAYSPKFSRVSCEQIYLSKLIGGEIMR